MFKGDVIESDYGLDDGGVGVRLQVEAKNVLHVIHAGFGSHLGF
jgi:hypothetical protein